MGGPRESLPIGGPLEESFKGGRESLIPGGPLIGGPPLPSPLPLDIPLGPPLGPPLGGPLGLSIPRGLSIPNLALFI